MKAIKIFVVSPPRTGTKSVMRAFYELGLRVKHCPSVTLERELENFDVFADTPIFDPNIFSQYVDAGHLFLYLNRSAESWLESFTRVGLRRNYEGMVIGDHSLFKAINWCDYNSLDSVFHGDTTDEGLLKAYREHWNTVQTIIPDSQLFSYDFKEGWGPLVEMRKMIRGEPGLYPDHALPHINMNTMFDQIIN